MRLPLRSWKKTLAQLGLQATPCERKNRNRHCAFESLDQRIVLSAVAGRYVFYNGSSFDGNDEAANSADDGAIAPDKAALLPGQTATSANVTNFVGINGIMVDIAGLASSSLSASDFTFKVGNDNSPAGWDSAPAPADVTVRVGEGMNGSDRVTIVWEFGDISNEWLQVTVKANGNTGLAIPDVFYFGNLMGDANGDFAVDNTTDYDLWHDAFLNDPNDQPITSAVDFDRNGTIDNSTDYSIWQSSYSSEATLVTLTAPGQYATFTNGSTTTIASFGPTNTTFGYLPGGSLGVGGIGGGFYESGPLPDVPIGMPVFVRQVDGGVVAVTSVAAVADAGTNNPNVTPTGGYYVPDDVDDEETFIAGAFQTISADGDAGPAHSTGSGTATVSTAATVATGSGISVNGIAFALANSSASEYTNYDPYSYSSGAVDRALGSTSGYVVWDLIDSQTSEPPPAEAAVVVDGFFVFEALQSENFVGPGENGKQASTGVEFTLNVSDGHYLHISVSNGIVEDYTISDGHNTFTLDSPELDPNAYGVSANFRWIIGAGSQVTVSYVTFSSTGTCAGFNGTSYTGTDGSYSAFADTLAYFQMDITGYVTAA